MEVAIDLAATLEGKGVLHIEIALDHAPEVYVLADDISLDDSLVACDVVWAEASAGFPDKTAFTRQMAALGINFSPMPESAAIRAGEIWKKARLEAAKRKEKLRLAIVPDILVGAHALECADALITRDRGFMRRYFSKLKVIDPSSGK